MDGATAAATAAAVGAEGGGGGGGAGGAVEHQLQYKWTLFTDGNQNKKLNPQNWNANIKKVAEVSTVEEFWGLFNNILEPSQLSHGTNYHLFKSGIEPKWEDKKNEVGGKWVLTSPRSKSDKLDEYWINTVMAVIGENFGEEQSRDICGIVVQVRKANDRIALWTASAADEKLQKSIGRHWKASATKGGLPEGIGLEFVVHKDSMATGSSYGSAAKYQV